MFGPRWNKIFRELWINRGRSLLVILSITVGVAAIGAVIGAQETLARDLPAHFAAINPASANLITDPFDANLLDQLRDEPGVTAAEARFLLNARVQVGPDQWQTVRLSVYPDYNNIQVNKIRPVSGAWPPPDRQILIERGSLMLTNAQVGDVLAVQLPDGTLRSLPVAGLVHDLNEPAGLFTNQVSGYISLETLEWLGYPQSFNEILLATSTNRMDEIQAIAGQVRDEVEGSGLTVYWTIVQDPTEHWFEPFLGPMTSVLGALGGLALLLSCFLVINTFSALLAQQTRQIGIMKAVGGRKGQITAIFTTLVLIFGAFALALAVPLGRLGAQASLNILAGYINFDPPAYQLSAQAVTLQVLLSLLLPFITAYFPIRRGATITIQKALSDTGITLKAAYGTSLIDRVLARLGSLPRPLMLSIRNTFRRKTRLAFTLITLTLGSALFISVQNVQASLNQTLEETLRYYNFDAVVSFDRPYRVEQLLSLTAEIPSVKAVETWGVANAHRVRPDGSESDGIMFVAPPVNTQMVQPILEDGRWLVPEDQNAIVINTDLVRQDPDLKVGSELILKVEGKETSWQVVGIVKSVLMGPWAYTNQPYFAYRLNKTGQASSVYLTMNLPAGETAETVLKQIERHFKQNGLHMSSISTVDELRQATMVQFQVLTGFLLIMALLVALVGSLGLMGTMGINVIERSREIGIMRAIGARGKTIRGIVITEGAFIGALSWLFGVILALPLGKLLGDLIGIGFLQAPLSNTISAGGALLWLGIVIVISMLASLAPARHATHRPIHEVLAYE